MSDASGSRRLPTRCPTCKGAVIERMPGATHGTYIWFHCLFCNHAWKHRLEDPREDPNGQLIGEVRVATRRRMKSRLGSVPVSVIAEDALRKHLEKKTLHADRETRKLQLTIAGLTATLRIAKADDDRLWKILQEDERNSRKAEAWSAAYNKTKDITEQIRKLEGRRQFLTSGEYFFEGIPSPMSTAETDAEGRFTLVIPRRGRYGLVARASRELFHKTETFFWIVWVSLDGERSKAVTLGSDNMVGAGSADSAVG